MVIIALAISAMGILQIFSATHDTIWQNAWWKQIVFVVVGLGLMWLSAVIDYHSLLGRVPILYLLSIVTLVAVAAILVADVRLRFLDIPVEGRDRNWTAHPAAQLAKGEEMGWFEQGSTIIALAPDGFSLCDTIQPGHRIRMGEPLLLRP